MSTEIEIKGRAGTIKIVVLGYENANSTNTSDANWLVCLVHIDLGPFRGEVNAALTTRDFEQFRQELRELLEGHRSSAAFESYEEVLELTVEAQPTGVTPISGTIRYSDGPNVALSFRLESDQSYLRYVLRDLDTLSQAFPVRI